MLYIKHKYAILQGAKIDIGVCLFNEVVRVFNVPGIDIHLFTPFEMVGTFNLPVKKFEVVEFIH